MPVAEFNFDEGADGTDDSNYLWGNAAFALAARITDAHRDYEWCAAIRGAEGGGLVKDLATHVFLTAQGDVAIRCPTEVAITKRVERELRDAGFIPLVHLGGTDSAAFLSVVSVHKPLLNDSPEVNANAGLALQLPYTFAVSRFVHFMRCMVRDKIGVCMSPAMMERFLNDWLRKYVNSDDAASIETKAQFALREGRVKIEVVAQPDICRATAFLSPRFQLDELTQPLRVSFDLPRGRFNRAGT